MKAVRITFILYWLLSIVLFGLPNSMKTDVLVLALAFSSVLAGITNLILVFLKLRDSVKTELFIYLFIDILAIISWVIPFYLLGNMA